MPRDSEMVERVARALLLQRQIEMVSQQWNEALRRENEWDDLNPHVREGWLMMARAAIAAMREPTRAMIETGDIAAGQAAEHPAKIWRAMIDSALSNLILMKSNAA